MIKWLKKNFDLIMVISLIMLALIVIPTRSQDYINGFIMGVSFMFTMSILLFGRLLKL